MDLIDIPFPRLLNASGETEKIIHPISVSINLKITPLSDASMQLPKGENVPARGYVELYTSIGSVGVFRVRSPQDAYGEDITTAELEHAIVEVGDYLVLDKYDEMISASEAVKKVFSHYRGSKWKLGDISALGSDKIALQTDHVRILEVLLEILEQKPNCMMDFDFSTTPWTVNIVSRGTIVSAEGRLSRNVNAAKVIYDDTELCTRVYYEIPDTASGKEPNLKWTYMDSDTISKYGIVEREVTTGLNYTKEEAERIAKEYLNKHKDPRVSVEISAEELSSVTGESFDTFTIGKLFRLALIDYGVTIEEVITGLSWSDVYDSPQDMIVYLADEEDIAINFLHDLDAKGGSGGGGGALKQQEEIWKEYFTRFEQSDYHFDLVANHVDENMSILQQAGLYIDSNGVLQYATDNEKNLMSHIHVQAGRIDIVSQKVDDNGNRISAAEIEVNGAKALINLNTEKIDKNTASINSANLRIDGANASITAQAQQIDAQGNKISSAELKLDGLAGEIELKVSKDGVISSINQTSEEITIQASKINLSGYVTASQLSAFRADFNNLVSGNTVASKIHATDITVTNTIGAKTINWNGRTLDMRIVSINGVTYNMMVAGGN